MTNHKNPDDVSIDPPRLPLFHPVRAIECQDAIAGVVTKMIDDAEVAGWTVHEITTAIIALADSIAMQEVDVEETNFLLREILDRKTLK